MSTISTIASRSIKLTKWTIGLALSAALVGCGNGGEALPPVVVAATNVAAPLSAATAPAVVSAGAFTFPTGFSGTSPGGAVTLAGATTVALPTATTFSITSGGGVATGSTAFGSCIFTVTASSVAILPVGTVLTVTPCTLNVTTSGDVAGTTNTDPATLVLGTATSTTTSVTVTLSSTGTVTIAGATVGTVTLVESTGATGGGG